MKRIALAALLAALTLPATAQVYRCEADGRVIYQNTPCADGAMARTVDTTNAGAGLQVVDVGALARLQARQRVELAERRAAEASARAQARIEARAAYRAAELAARQDQAAALAAIADELRQLRTDGLGVAVYRQPRLVRWREGDKWR